MTARAEQASSGRIVAGGVRLGRIAGSEVLIHWSLIVIFGLIAANLGVGALPCLLYTSPSPRD